MISPMPMPAERTHTQTTAARRHLRRYHPKLLSYLEPVQGLMPADRAAVAALKTVTVEDQKEQVHS